MDAIEKVRVERVATQTAIADLRSQLAVLEDKEKRLAITEATLAELMGMPNAPDVFSGERGSVKRMVLAEFSPGMILTKMDVVSRLSIKGIQVNEGTVGSTLSKAIGDELEKVGPNGYRLRNGESPAGAGLSESN